MANETERPKLVAADQVAEKQSAPSSSTTPVANGREYGERGRSETSGEYRVVARRYRPQSFADLVGQGMVCQALGNAITTDRVGHAYLFTGARGVGKTSTARILAKSLNCVHGPTIDPCGQCDICARIAQGDEIDVLEIDGASNRGIDEIRQLRSNVGIRPSRARFKIYIIDEVHMLTKEAFNALLKTLEEPPEHVKFIFCTTEPGKIPVTVLSRCQRFDFSPVLTTDIVERLQYIVDQEGAEADRDALDLLARRAAGSMRDSQSLLEQLLSFVNGRITIDDVHSLLGTAPDVRLQAILDALNRHDAAGALNEADAALRSGVDAGQLGEQIVGCLRDMMAALVGCDGRLLLHHRPSDLQSLQQAAENWGLETLLAAAQIVDQSLARMRYSVHERILLELALVRVARLENLESLTSLIQRLEAGELVDGGPDEEKKNRPVTESRDPLDERVCLSGIEDPLRRSDTVHHAPGAPHLRSGLPTGVDSDPPRVAQVLAGKAGLHPDHVGRSWRVALERLNDMTADHASMADFIAISGPNQLVVRFRQVYNSSKTFCERPDRRQTLESAVSEVVGGPVELTFELIQDDPTGTNPRRPAMSRQQLRQQVLRHPMVERAITLFEAELINVDLASPTPTAGAAGQGEKEPDGV